MLSLEKIVSYSVVAVTSYSVWLLIWSKVLYNLCNNSCANLIAGLNAASVVKYLGFILVLALFIYSYYFFKPRSLWGMESYLKSTFNDASTIDVALVDGNKVQDLHRIYEAYKFAIEMEKFYEKLIWQTAGIFIPSALALSGYALGSFRNVQGNGTSYVVLIAGFTIGFLLYSMYLLICITCEPIDLSLFIWKTL